MTDKTKRIILIAAGVLLCAVLVVGIVSRLAAVPMPCLLYTSRCV